MAAIRVLLLEDNPLDAELILASLRAGGVECDARRVDTREDFGRALVDCPDLILADYSLPGFDGISALHLARQDCPEVPFVFVTGALGEELAIETLRSGATDYVLKDRLERLVPAVQRALREAQERAERRRAEEALRASEERLRLLIDSARDYVIITLGPDGNVVEWNAGAERLLGYRREEVVGGSCDRFYPPDEAGRAAQVLGEARAAGQAEEEGWQLRKDGTRFWASGVTAALRDAGGRLRGFAKILRDLSERKRMEEELRQRADELAEADRRKDEFLAMLGHELRNPLSPIRSAVEVMQQLGLADPTLRWAHDVVQRQVEHLTRLVDDLLDVSRINRDLIRLQRKPVELAQVVEQAVETVRPLLDGRQHRVTVALPAERLWLEADSARLVQVFTNLLHNAAKYTDPGGHVRVTAERAGPEAVVRVRDNGMGIAPALLPHIFDAFTQADHSLARTPGGLGVGLTLVRRLVQMHGGTVEAYSGGPGQGSEFTVRLPLRSAPHGQKASLDGEALPAARPRKVLIVDDNVDGAQGLALLLQLRGHRVLLAHDGAAGLEVARAQRPDVVVLDIGLPKLDGYAVARELRRLPGMEGVLLIAATGYGQDEDRRRARDAGFDYHLVKPVDPSVLSKLLARPDAHAPAAREEHPARL
jgi:PAS domain S-box-containing protein